jgi:hypothetical protein
LEDVRANLQIITENPKLGGSAKPPASSEMGRKKLSGEILKSSI